MDQKQKDIRWYHNPDFITDLIILLIAVIIILSQSFAINNNLSTQDILMNIINHNSIYLIVLVYFIALKTKFGKKYFDFLNVFLILLYFITSITSVLTLFQSFSLETFLSCILQLTLFIYLFHILLRRTRIWKEFHLAKSPFNDVDNDTYFNIIMVLVVMLLALDLIVTTTLDGTILALLDAGYLLIFSRYIYLYGAFLNEKETVVPVMKEKVEEEVKVSEKVESKEEKKEVKKKKTTKKVQSKMKEDK